jgi:hypothetical protein
VSLPSSPSLNNRFGLSDVTASSGTNPITLQLISSQRLYGNVQNYIINVDGGYVEFIYIDSTTGWIATR